MKTKPRHDRQTGLRLVLAALLLLAAWPALRAQDSAEPKFRLDVYGAAMLDMGYNFGQSDSNWFDVVRPTKLPAYEGQYGTDGNWFMGIRQSRLGFKGFFPTALGELKTIFEFELFGTGAVAGQTTFRIRHAYGELGHFGAGQTWSPFMDPDVFPNSVEYWGPNGMVFFRNVQIRWMPIMGDTTVTIALERPGASADQGIYQDRIELQGVKARFPLPDLSANIRKSGKWGHVQLAAMLRRMMWVDTNAGQDEYPYDLSGKAFGWGLNASGNYNTGMGTIRASLVVGEGIQNYMNDAPVDVGIQNNFGNPVKPIIGVPLPIFALVFFYDHTWNDKFTSTIGGSYLNITNSDAQSYDAFKRGYYALVNVLYYPAPNFFCGPELQFGRRENFKGESTGMSPWTYNDWRIQFSAKYSFKTSIGGK